jgi:hypothetical protein
MDRGEVRKLMQILLQAMVAGDTAAQKAAREKRARAAAELAPQIRARARARISPSMASPGNANA